MATWDYNRKYKDQEGWLEEEEYEIKAQFNTTSDTGWFLTHEGESVLHFNLQNIDLYIEILQQIKKDH